MAREQPSYPSREALAARSSGQEVTSVGEHAVTTLDRPRMTEEMLRAVVDVSEPGGIPPTNPTPEVLPVARRSLVRPWLTGVVVVCAALALGALCGAWLAWGWSS